LSVYSEALGLVRLIVLNAALAAPMLGSRGSLNECEVDVEVYSEAMAPYSTSNDLVKQYSQAVLF